MPPTSSATEHDRLFSSPLTQLASNFAFTEGPTPDPAGNVYFTDQPNDRILLWSSSDNRITTFLQPSGRSNGLCLSPDGQILSCADEHNQLWSINPATKQITVLVRDYQGKLLNGPNDVWAHPAGHVYFSDPLYPRKYWTRSPDSQLDGQHVYHLSPDRQTLTRVTHDLEKPNGLVGTPDGRTLFVADIKANRTYAFTVAPNGELHDKRLFCPRGADGITLDAAGNLYLTGYANEVAIFDPTGHPLTTLHLPTPDKTSNICFASPDRHTLFITAGAYVYSIRTRNPGADTPRSNV